MIKVVLVLQRMRAHYSTNLTASLHTPTVEATKSTAPQAKAPAPPLEQETQTLTNVPGRSDGVGSWRRPNKVPLAKGGASKHQSNVDTKKPQSQTAAQQPTRPRKLLAVSASLSFKDVAARNTEHKTDEQKTDAVAEPTSPAAPEPEATDPSTQGVSGPTTPERPAREIVTPGDSSSETEPAGELAWGEEETVHAEDPVYVPLTMYLSEEDAKAVVQEQLEYYFSIENLCRDIFLRKHMVSGPFP